MQAQEIVLALFSLCLPSIHGQDIVIFNAADQAVIRDPITGIYAGNFIETKSAKLNVPSLKDMNVTSKSRCQYECLKDSRCKSYNIAVSPNSVGQYKCQILDKEMVKFSQFLIHNENSFNHYSIKTKCSPSPCINFQNCVPHYNNNSYMCGCNSPYYGALCNGTFYWRSWSAWSAWTAKATCLDEIRTRSRTPCRHPFLSATNSDCQGSGTQTEDNKKDDPSAGCDIPLGMQKKCIADDKITANTHVNSVNQPQFGRLNLVEYEGGWTGSKAEDYLQVDLTYLTTVTAYATQGRAINPIFSKTIKLMYSKGMTNWLQYHSTHPYVFQANVDHLTAVKTILPKGAIVTRGVRFVVMTYTGQPSLRVEIYGCTYVP